MMNKLFVPALLAALLAIFAAPASFAGSDSELDLDFDGDGTISRFDNCYLYPNPTQFDADGDGFGNACDPDLNNDGIVDFRDLSLFSEVIFTNNAEADFNEDGVVNFLDLRVFRQGFNNGRPGPGLIMHWVGDSGFWNERTNWYPPQVPSFFYEYAVIDSPESVVVTIASGVTAGAKHLEVSGNLVVCGSLIVRFSTTVTGSLTKDCELGRIEMASGIDLGGELVLNSGTLYTPAVRRIEDTSPGMTVRGVSRIDSFEFPSSFTTDVDLSIEPGTSLIAGVSDIVLDGASIVFKSEEDLPAYLSFGQAVTLTGASSLKFEGPGATSALGTLFTIEGTLEIGPDSEVQIEPQANAYLRTRIVNNGSIAVSNEAKLSFENFGVVTNAGTIECRSGGRLLEFDTGFNASGDSVLINQTDASVFVDDCTTTWPTRIVNQGRYEVTNSLLNMPLIGSSGVPLEITNSDISIREFQPPIPAEFYVFAPANENSVLVNGLFDLGNSTLTIDAAKWRFSEDDFTRFEFGTIESETPLTVNSGAKLGVFGVTVDMPINLESGSELALFQNINIKHDISFVDPANCASPPDSPTALRLNWPLNGLTNNIKINAISSNKSGCLNAEISTGLNYVVPDLVDIVVSNAAMTIRADSGRRIELQGETTVTGANAQLNLQQVLNAGIISCLEGATVNASGTANNPFVNEQSFSSGECDVNFSDYWINNGSYFSANGTLSLTGPEGTSYTPGAGVFITEGTRVLFDLDISDPSQLNMINVVPGSGGTFTFSGTITNPGPELDLNDFPSDTEFGDGFELADTRVTGFHVFRLSGSTTLRNVELALPTVVPTNSTLNVFDQLTLDDATLVIQSNSLNNIASMTRLLLHGVSNIAGTGELILRPLGTGAISELVQTVDDMSLSVDAGITTSCFSGGQCVVKAGAGTGKIDLFGNLFVSDETTRLRLESDTTVYRTANLQYQGQMRVADATNLNFSGPESGLETALFNGTMRPAIVVEGTATIDISEAFLSFVPGDSYVLPSEETVTVLSHEGSAQRVGEFADVSGALIDGQLFTADYSSPDLTIFRGPSFTSPALTK